MGKKWKITAALAAVGSAIASALYLEKKENREKVKKTVHDIESRAVSATKKAINEAEKKTSKAKKAAEKKASKTKKTVKKKSQKAKKVARKKTHKTAKKVSKKTKTPSITDIKGVGPATAKKLKKANISSVAQLRRYKNADSLAKRADLGEVEAQNIIDEVSKL